AAAITFEALEAVGLSTQPLADLTMQVLRTSPKGKWHVPGTDADRCPYVARVYGCQRSDLPTQPVPVLGEYDWCSHCIHRVGLPGPAGAFYTVAGLIVAAAGWVTALEEHAPGMEWLDLARWTCRTPFGPPDPMPDLLAGLAGIRDWSRPDAGGMALDVWLAAIAQDGDAEAAFAAMLTAVEECYQRAPVRDVSLLPQPALTPPDGHDSPAAWAAAEYAQLRRYTV